MSSDEEEQLEATTYNIVVGTYEDFIVGYTLHARLPNAKRLNNTNTNGDNNEKISDISNDEETDIKSNKRKNKQQTNQTPVKKFTYARDELVYELDQSFAIRSHSGSVKTIESTQNGRYLVSAGSEEVVNLYELNKRRLTHTFDGAINCFEFVGSTHLIAGSEDSNIYIYDLKAGMKKSLTLAKTFTGHKKAVYSLSVHPTNKLFLSLGKDCTMRTWNLITGRPAFVTNISKEAHIVKWSHTGDDFALAANNQIHLYKTEDGSQNFSSRFEKRINAVEFSSKNNSLLLAFDNGSLLLLCLKSKIPLLDFEAHTSRIKSIRLMNDTLLASCSSDGSIKVWKFDNDINKKIKPTTLVSVETGARLTCMTVSKC